MRKTWNTNSLWKYVLTSWSLFKVLHPAFHCVNNSERMYRLDFLQVLRGRCGKNMITSSKTSVKLSKRTFVCVLKSTINTEPQRTFWFDEWFNEAFLTRRLYGDVAKTGDKSYLHCGLYSLKSNLKLIKSI